MFAKWLVEQGVCVIWPLVIECLVMPEESKSVCVCEVLF